MYYVFENKAKIQMLIIYVIGTHRERERERGGGGEERVNELALDR